MTFAVNIKNTSRMLVRVALLLCMVLPVACNKDFLDTKPRTDILVPSTLTDFQALLDNYSIMNETPQLGELFSDDYYLTPSFWQTLVSPHERNAYTWAQDLYGSQRTVDDWNKPYTQVMYANIILEGLKKLDSTRQQQTWYNIKGHALFARAFA